MVHPSVEELLSQFTPEELASILREELDAAGIPYTSNADDKFEFVPISVVDLDVPYMSVEQNMSVEQMEMKTGKITIPAVAAAMKANYENAQERGEDLVVTVRSDTVSKYQPTSDYCFAA